MLKTKYLKNLTLIPYLNVCVCVCVRGGYYSLKPWRIYTEQKSNFFIKSHV